MKFRCETDGHIIEPLGREGLQWEDFWVDIILEFGEHSPGWRILSIDHNAYQLRVGQVGSENNVHTLTLLDPPTPPKYSREQILEMFVR